MIGRIIPMNGRVVPMNGRNIAMNQAVFKRTKPSLPVQEVKKEHHCEVCSSIILTKSIERHYLSKVHKKKLQKAKKQKIELQKLEKKMKRLEKKINGKR